MALAPSKETRAMLAATYGVRFTPPAEDTKATAPQARRPSVTTRTLLTTLYGVEYTPSPTHPMQWLGEDVEEEEEDKAKAKAKKEEEVDAAPWAEQAVLQFTP